MTAQPDGIEPVDAIDQVLGDSGAIPVGAGPVDQQVDVPAARERARAIPEATVARLAVYLRVLAGRAEAGVATLSSEELANAAGVNSAKLRKDLSYLGSYGTRGVGYDVEILIGQVERVLGLTRKHSVAVIGIGNLGHALAGYGGFSSRGFPVTALFDVDPDLVGIRIAGVEVHPTSAIPEVCAALDVTIGVIATPGEGAQSVCDLLVAAGVRSILNFAPVVLQVPGHVEVRKVDLAVEMQILSFHVSRRDLEDDPIAAPASGAAEHAATNGSAAGSATNGSATNGSATNGDGRRRNGSAVGAAAHAVDAVKAAVRRAVVRP